MKRKPRAYSREKRKEQVIGQFGIWHRNGDTEPKTMYRIARALDLIPSTKFTEILLEMEVEGKLKTEWREQSGRWATRTYLLVDSLIITEKWGRRRIVVKHKGVERGQLELAL